MCGFDRDTQQKVQDCGSCGCGQSVSSGQHVQGASETITSGEFTFTVHYCANCHARMT